MTLLQKIQNLTWYNGIGKLKEILLELRNLIGNGSGTPDLQAVTDLPQVSNDFADDAAAATGGIPVGGLYHTSGTVKIRLT